MNTTQKIILSIWVLIFVLLVAVLIGMSFQYPTSYKTTTPSQAFNPNTGSYSTLPSGLVVHPPITQIQNFWEGIYTVIGLVVVISTIAFIFYKLWADKK